MIIILRISMFYIQRVLADCWGGKDSAIGRQSQTQTVYVTALSSYAQCSNDTPLRLRLAQIALSFRPQKFAKMRCL